MAFFSRFFRKTSEKQLSNKQLSDELDEKFNSMNNDQSPDLKPSKYLTWDEFCEIFTTVEYQFSFFYEDYIVVITHYEPVGFFVVECFQSEKYETPQELLDNARIDGRSLKEIWNEFVFCSRSIPVRATPYAKRIG